MESLQDILWALQWRHNERVGVSNHRRLDCFSTVCSGTDEKPSKLRVTGLCAENSPLTGEFPAQRTSNTEKKFPFDDVIMVT